MSHLAEGKIEFKLDIRYLFKGFGIYFYYEFEKVYNEAFFHSVSRSEVEKKHSSLLWFGLERYFNK